MRQPSPWTPKDAGATAVPLGMLSKCIVAIALVAIGGPWSRADIALAVGIVLALLGVQPWTKECKFISKWLIQLCVVMLGFRLDLAVLAHSAVDGLVLALGTIIGAVVVGLLLGKLFRTGREISTLVTSGTAICGGSAIVAIGSAIGATTANMAVATGAIFVLNAIGLWTLPVIGHALHMSDVQFGQWAGVALHDIASVGGAAKGYHAGALDSSVAFDTANIVKLTRVIWITPIAILAGRYMSSGAAAGKRAPFPWFIVCFLVASALRTSFPQLASFQVNIAQVSGVGFQIALFLIGMGLSRHALMTVGWRAIAQAATLWVLIAGASLLAIRWMID